MRDDEELWKGLMVGWIDDSHIQSSLILLQNITVGGGGGVGGCGAMDGVGDDGGQGVNGGSAEVGDQLQLIGLDSFDLLTGNLSYSSHFAKSFPYYTVELVPAYHINVCMMLAPTIKKTINYIRIELFTVQSLCNSKFRIIGISINRRMKTIENKKKM